MRGLRTVVAIALAMCLSPDGVRGDDKDLEQRVAELERMIGEGDTQDADRLSVLWHHGLLFENAKFRFNIGGRIMVDTAYFKQSDAALAAGGNFQDGTEFRRARFFIGGTVYEVMTFKAQFDFAGGDVDFKDVWVGMKNLPIGEFRVGHQKEPLGLEELVSSKYIMFMERALTSTFTPERNTGFKVIKNFAGKRGSLQAGGFRETDAYGDGAEDGGRNFTARVSYAPVYNNDGKQVVHFGLAGSVRNPAGGVVRYSAHPGSHLAGTVVDTGSITNVDRVIIGGAEALLILGSVTAQGEVIHVVLKRSGGSDDANFQAAYAAISYWLTGEHRPYKNGVTGRVSPISDFSVSEGGGCGAWELAARIDTIDLDDEGVHGGDIDRQLTVGANWHLNPNARIMFNWVNSRLDRGQVDAAMMRVQLDF